MVNIDLGPIILRCRRRRWIDADLAFGFHLLAIYSAIPFVGFLLTIPLLWLVVYLKINPPLLRNPPLGVLTLMWFTASCVAFHWFYTRTAGTDSLVLHRDGFHYRKQIVRFQDLSSIRLGRVPPRFLVGLLSFYRLASPVSSQARGFIRLWERSDQSSLTLGFKNGDWWSMTRVFDLYEPDDMDLFMFKISELTSDLVDWYYDEVGVSPEV